MGILDSLFSSGTKGLNKSAAEAERRLAAGKAEAEATLQQGRGDINAGYDKAVGIYDAAQPGLLDYLRQGYAGANDALTSGYGAAETAVTDAATRANATLDPFYQSGLKSQGLYDTAMGVGEGGAAGAKQFYEDYGANDPFRAFRDEQAQREIERRYNAQGSYSGGGDGGGSGRFATATARASLERGTQDLNTYLDRLERAGGRGQQVAGQMSSNTMTAGSQVAGLKTGLADRIGANKVGEGSALAQLGMNITGAKAGLETGRGTALAGNNNNLANLQYGYGQQTAANEINLSNALTTARARPGQNLISLAGTAAMAFNPTSALSKLGQGAIGSWTTTGQRA